MAARTNIPILLLTGFLGGGKTSLLRNWLREGPLAGAVAIVNELGEVGLDDRLVRAATVQPYLIGSGCACCDAADDLLSTLEDLFRARLQRMIPAFPWVVIETTGLADPLPIAATIARHPVLGERFHVAGVVTVVDATLGLARLDSFAEFAGQLASATVLVVTKADRATPDEIARIVAELAARRPGVATLISSGADLSGQTLLAALAEAAPASAMTGATDAAAQHTPGVSSAFADLPDALDFTIFENALRSAVRDFGARILRLKGVVRTHAPAQTTLVQVAPDGAIEIAPDPAPQAPARYGLTIIARDIPAGIVAARLRSALSRPA